MRAVKILPMYLLSLLVAGGGQGCSAEADIPSFSSSREAIETFTSPAGKSQDPAWVAARDAVLMSLRDARYSADEIGLFLSRVYEGDAHHPAGSGAWNFRYGEHLAAYYESYKTIHPLEKQTYSIPATLSWSMNYCRFPDDKWPADFQTFVGISAVPAWRASQGWVVRVTDPWGNSTVGLAGVRFAVPIPPLDVGHVQMPLTVELLPHCPDRDIEATPVQSQTLELEFAVEDVLAGYDTVRDDHLNAIIADCIVLEPERIDLGERDAALNEFVVMVPGLIGLRQPEEVRNVACGIELLLIDAEGVERTRSIIATYSGKSVIRPFDAPRTVLCDNDDILKWKVVLRSNPSVVRMLGPGVLDDIRAGRVKVWHGQAERPLADFVSNDVNGQM